MRPARISPGQSHRLVRSTSRKPASQIGHKMDPHRYTSLAPALSLGKRVGATTVNKLPSAPTGVPEIVTTDAAAEAPTAHLRAPGAGAGPSRCVVCAENMGRYTCPRCLAQYCTAACYQKHGERCTESFYQEHVVDELRARPVSSDAERREILAILKRLQADAEKTDEVSIDGDSSERGANVEFVGTALEHLQLDENTEWDHLSAEQQADFIQAVKSGKLGDLVQPWEPWWRTAGVVVESEDQADVGIATLPHGPQALCAAPTAQAPQKPQTDADFLEQTFATGGGIKGKHISIEAADEDSNYDLRDASESSETPTRRVPRVPRDIPALRSLTSKPPSPLLPYSLAGLLWCYAFAQRRCNGDLTGDPLMETEAAHSILAAGGGLLVNPTRAPPTPPPASVAESLQQCIENCVKTDGPLAEVLLLELAEDVEALLTHKARVLAALSHAHCTLLRAASSARSKAMRANLDKGARKFWFFLSWANEQTLEVMHMTRMQACLAKQSFERRLNEMTTMRACNTGPTGPARLPEVASSGALRDRSDEATKPSLIQEL